MARQPTQTRADGRRPRRWLLYLGLVACVIIVGPIVALSWANYSGYCLRDLRRVSESEALEAVFRRLNGPGNFDGKELVPYQSFGEYSSLRPNCCKVLPQGSFRGRPDFLDRVSGNVAYIIEFEYYRRWRGQTGEIVTDPVSNLPLFSVSVCGQAAHL